MILRLSHPCSFSFALNCILVPHDGLENCGCLRSVASKECTATCGVSRRLVHFA